jgi:AraC-like DNA-binding protein
MVALEFTRATRATMQMQMHREELAERIAQAIAGDGTAQPLPGVNLYRHTVTREPLHNIIGPSLCVVAQGSKEFLLGEQCFRYDASHYLLTTVDLPNIGQVIEASPEHPLLSLRLDLDPALVSSVVAEAGASVAMAPVAVRAIAVSQMNATLLEDVVRLIRLIETPDQAHILQPLLMREIIYHLLIGEQGGRLLHLAQLGGYHPTITQVIERLRQDFAQPLRIEQLAQEVGMSVSGLHAHFKAVTALSPLQYLKRLRLQEARRLLMNEHLDAASAAMRVGYHDAAHFNREYKSLFGTPPMRNVSQLRENEVASDR